MRVPDALRREWSREAAWLAALPELVEACADDWGLALEEPVDTPHSLVIPAGHAVLKLNAPGHFEADFEADALAHYDGAGAVRLLAHDPSRRALLVERCVPGTQLGDEPEATAALLPRLWRPPAPDHPFRSLTDEAARWAEEVPFRWETGGRPFERELLDYAVDVFRSGSNTDVVANQDLHGANVLRAEREPWLVIDPKPLVAERELDGVGLLRNAADPTRWLAALAGLGLDRERVRGWAVAHALAWGFDERGWSERAIASARRILATRSDPRGR